MATDATIIQLVVAPGLNANTLTALASAPLGMTCLVYVQPSTITFYASKTNNLNTALVIGSSPATNGVFIHQGLANGETWYYWARAVDADGNTGAFYPATTAGKPATTLTAAPGPNSVGETELQDGGVTNSKVANAAITNAKIANATITSAKINDLSADKITGGTISATISINGPTITGGTIRTAASGQRVEIIGSVNKISAYDASNRELFSTGGLTGYSSVFINSYITIGPALFAGANVDGNDAHGIRGRNLATGGGHGIVGVSRAGGGWAFYAQAGNYGPFTGAHDALMRKSDLAEIGDIVVDDGVLARAGVDNVLTRIKRANQVGQRGVVGVLSKRTEFHPEAHLSGLPYSDNDAPATFIKRHFAEKYDRCTINGVGEGQVNVCGRSGNFDLGDLIIASDMSGKGQRQSDDIVRSYTVARIREAVTFDHPDQVKRVACIYLCG